MIISEVFASLLVSTAYANEVSDAQLEQCVTYFTQGGLYEWIFGGLTVAFFVFTALTKKNIPDMVKQFLSVAKVIGRKFLKK